MAIEQTTDSLEEGFVSQREPSPSEENKSEEDALREISSAEMDEVYAQMLLEFEGGIEEVIALVEKDKENVLEIKKKNRLPYDIEGERISEVEKLFEDDFNSTAMVSASIPGASLTGKLADEEKGTLGAYPWENPPIYSSLLDAYVFFLDNVEDEIPQVNELLLAGIPAESIARTATFLAYTEGLINVDISELLITPLMFYFVAQAKKEGIEANIFNDVPDDDVSPQQVLDIMQDLNPTAYEGLMEDVEAEAEVMEGAKTELMQDPIIGSFLEMGETE